MKTLTTPFASLLALILALPAHAVSRSATPFTDAELDQLLAPVALYPDSVLSHVLIAATVPDEVEAAADWSNRHPDVRGQVAVDAVEGRNWDPSVKALVAFPEVLERMDEDPEWTEDLGAAFLDQEAAVMGRVQFLRDRAAEAGTLDRLEHVRVVREREYIYLEPAVRHVVYVPYYDPWRVYGAWWWPSYPPHHWAWWGGYPSRYYYGSTFYWGVGFHLGPSYYYSRFNWPARYVVVSRPHRHYAPTPGYSSRRTMRREGHSFAQVQRQAPNGSWSGQAARVGQPRTGLRSAEDAPAPRVQSRSRSHDRRNSAHVQRELSARRESSARRDEASRGEAGDASSLRGDQRRRDADTPRVERGGAPERHEPRVRPYREAVPEGRASASDRAGSRRPPPSPERAPDAGPRESRGERHQERGHSRQEPGRDVGRDSERRSER